MNCISIPDGTGYPTALAKRGRIDAGNRSGSETLVERRYSTANPGGCETNFAGRSNRCDSFTRRLKDAKERQRQGRDSEQASACDFDWRHPVELVARSCQLLSAHPVAFHTGRYHDGGQWLCDSFASLSLCVNESFGDSHTSSRSQSRRRQVSPRAGYSATPAPKSSSSGAGF